VEVLVGAAATSSVAATRSTAEAATYEVVEAVATTEVDTATVSKKKDASAEPILFGDEDSYSEEEASTSSFEPSGKSGDGKFLLIFFHLLFYLCLSFNTFL
jgi:hypothetical protein